MITLKWCVAVILISVVYGCTDKQSAIFVINGGTKLPSSSTACFNTCARSNCTGVFFHQEKCITIDRDNFFGQIPKNSYIEKHCVKKIPHNLLVTEWNDRMLVGYTKKLVQIEDKAKCLAACESEKTFKCLSVMYYEHSTDCLMNSATATQDNMKMDTEGYPVSYMELHGLKDATHCLNAFKTIAADEIEIRGDSKILDGTKGLSHCISECKDCDFIFFNEIYHECYLVYYDPSKQNYDFLDDEYQILANACTQKTECNARNSMYISYNVPVPDEKLRNKCLEMCTMSEDCHYSYISPNLNECVVTRKIMGLPLSAQRLCIDVSDLSDGSAILFDEIGGCKAEDNGDFISKDLELYECMQLCATHPTRSCESIGYTSSKECYLHDRTVEIDMMNNNCTVFSLNVMTFESAIDKEKVEKLPIPGDSKVKKPNKAKTYSTGNKDRQKKVAENKLLIEKSTKKPVDINVKIATQCNFGDITVKVNTKNIENGEVYVRNGHTNCSTNIDENGEAILKINHNDTSCPMIKNGDIYHTVIVVTQNIGNATLITIDDQLFKVRCDYSNQKKTVAVAKTMNLRTSTYSSLDIYGKVKVKPMSIELRTKRDIVKDQTVKLGQSLDLVFKAENTKKFVVRSCMAIDNEGDEKIVLIKNGCATQNAKEYVLRGEMEETTDGFMLPFRAFRFKKGEGVKIECELKYCKKCGKASCSSRNRRYVNEEIDALTAEVDEQIHAEFLVKNSTMSITNNEGYCFGIFNFVTITGICSIVIGVQLIVLIYACLKGVYERKRKNDIEYY